MIPFFKTTIGKEEKEALSQVIDSGWLVQGKKTQELEERFAEYVGAKHAIFVDSGTSALFLALKDYLRNLPEKPEYCHVPSITFTSTAEVVVNCGLKPYFHDVYRDTMCMEEFHGVSIPVNLTGNKTINPDAPIIDSAHRIEMNDVKDSKARWCYSFYATKNMSTVQGGMIATNDDDSAKWLKAARDHGISKGTLERYTQKIPTYSIDFVGYRMKADDLRAVIGLEQLKKLPAMTQRRNEIVAEYNSNLGLARSGNHLYPILVSNREAFFDAMALAEIQCSVHFLPLHKMPAYNNYPHGDMPNTDYLGEHLVSLPLFPDMTDEQVDYISEQVLKTNLLINE